MSTETPRATWTVPKVDCLSQRGIHYPLPKLMLSFDFTSSFKPCTRAYLNVMPFFFATRNLSVWCCYEKTLSSSPGFCSSFQSHPLRLQYTSAYPHSVSANPCLQPTFFKAGGENAEKIKTEFTNLKVCTLIIPYTCLFILSGASLKESNREAVIISVKRQHYLFAHQQKLLTLPLPFRMQKFWGCLQFMAGASSTS